MKILLVDPSELMRIALFSWVPEHEVVWATDIDMAKARLETPHIEVILCEDNMPSLRRGEAAEILKTLAPSIPLVRISHDNEYCLSKTREQIKHVIDRAEFVELRQLVKIASDVIQQACTTISRNK